MAHYVKVCYARLEVDSDKISTTSLRGYFGHLFIHDPEFHHHSESSHHYPKIQYKKINGHLMVVGFSNYADIVFQRMTEVDHIALTDKKIYVNNIEIEVKKNEIGQTQTNYRFATPWLGLNEENYKRYLNLKLNERKSFLERILVGNILSMLKGLEIRIEFKIEVNISQIRSKTIIVHHNKFAGFFCNWNSNISLPEYCGIGKSVSKGFGVVVKNDQEDCKRWNYRS